MTYAQLLRVLRILASVEGYLWAEGDSRPDWIVEELDEVQGLVQRELARIAGEELK